MADKRDIEIEKLKTLVAQMNTQTSQNEREKQNMRNIRGQLDAQIDIFNQIHRFSGQAFRAGSQQALLGLIPEGIVDIFQVEIGAIFLLDVSGEHLNLLGSCNMQVENRRMPVLREWIARPAFTNVAHQQVVVESPPGEDSPFYTLRLAHAITVALFDNDRRVIGLLLGGVTEEGAGIYDFDAETSAASFMVYAQQMNGIYNNFEAIAQAKHAGEAKMQFLANLSHEIRTPMNAISGVAQIAGRKDRLEDYRRAMEQINTSMKHLLGLLGDVLDISKIEEGKMSLHHEPFDLDAMLESVRSNMLPAAQEKEIALRVRQETTPSLHLVGDSMRLSQVLLNLLSNAIKFTARGGQIDMDIAERSYDGERVLLRFSVRDSGIGMSQETIRRIFSPFEQADTSTSRKYGGTGLGLTISQRIVELMGSKIKVESQEGNGSRFYFSVWFDVETARAAVAVDGETPLRKDGHYDFSGFRILVVDDVDINREIVYAFLEDTGAAYEGAANGQEAVDKVAASPAGYYDLILMDVQMPVLDGCAATRAIRALGRPDAAGIVILAMTANVFKEDMQRVADAGMDGHIGKPVDYATTMDFIARCLAETRRKKQR